ncbi:FAD-dependent oxidoreductase [Streptomyces sp. NA02950]|uniref:NAD(P)/FAD-dependent oxidoreductase n=1 Tax=Streptomyces sp. NA02950 TaxID=2742137 RepID=UPI001591528C|nr:FAD-dependent oxidoreductase [Streptomyces sp. NA02950]QKV97006.1 FAD-dependent oxidoreductase [Streptomyces sp. NA02950]
MTRGRTTARTLVLIGHGMAGHRLVEGMRARDPAGTWRIVVLAEEDRPAYDRTALSSYLEAGPGALDLGLATPESLNDPRVELRLGTPAAAIDRRARTVTTAGGERIGYDALVLATGSRPFVPPVAGHDLPGCFVYRTVEDLDALRAAAFPGRPGVVIGGGLLGLEAANALRVLGMRPHVIEAAPHLMPAQLDEGAGQVLAGLVSELGVGVRCGTATESVDAGPDGRVCAVTLSDATRVEAALVVFCAGIRPRDELAGPAGLEKGPRGGVLVDARCRTADPFIWAVGEGAAVEGRCYGLAAPGYRMAESVVDQLLNLGDTPFPGADTSTRLKLLGVDVAGFGDTHAETEGAMELIHADRAARTYTKLVLAPDTRTLLGGVLVGDARPYSLLRSLVGHELPAPPEQLLSPAHGVHPSRS